MITRGQGQVCAEQHPHARSPQPQHTHHTQHTVFGLDPEAFMTTHNMLALHLWLVINRLKPEDR